MHSSEKGSHNWPKGQAPMESNLPLRQWMRLPGNEIWANLLTQKTLPGMNARSFDAAAPVPQTTVPSPKEEEIGRGKAEMPAGLPPTQDRQWQPPTAFLREQNPGVGVMKWPLLVITVMSSAANVVRRIPVPNAARLMKITHTGGNAGSVLTSPSQFTLPLTAITADVQDYVQASTAPMVSPLDQWWDCEEMTELFLGFTSMDVIASVSFWQAWGPRV